MFCIGVLGLSKDAYFNLTPAETRAIYDGYLFNRDIMSANFRMIYSLQYHQFAKQQLTLHQLWPLSIDKDHKEELTEEQMYARNAEIERQFFAKQKNK